MEDVAVVERVHRPCDLLTGLVPLAEDGGAARADAGPDRIGGADRQALQRVA